MAQTLRQALQSALAATALSALEGTTGEKMEYHNRNTATVTVTAQPNAIIGDLDEDLGIIRNTVELSIVIPMQPGFPPPAGGVAVGDRIKWDDEFYRVERYRADSIRAVYTLECRNIRADKLGAVR